MTWAPATNNGHTVRRRYGAERRAVAGDLAAEHDGVVHRRMLARHGIDRDGIRNEVAAGRWFKVGRHTIAIGSAELTTVARWWRAGGAQCGRAVPARGSTVRPPWWRVA